MIFRVVATNINALSGRKDTLLSASVRIKMASIHVVADLALEKATVIKRVVGKWSVRFRLCLCTVKCHKHEHNGQCLKFKKKHFLENNDEPKKQTNIDISKQKLFTTINFRLGPILSYYCWVFNTMRRWFLHSTVVNEAVVLSIRNTFLTIFEFKFFILAPFRLDNYGYSTDLVLI